MKLITAFSAAILSIAPAAAFAQDASTNGRGAGEKSVGPASENGDSSTGNTVNPGGTGRSAAERSAPATPSDSRMTPDNAQAPSGR